MKCIRFLPLLLLISCTATGHPLNVNGIKQLDNLPSASASSYVNGVLYTVGDDSPSLYALDPAFNIISAFDIGNGQPQENGRITGGLKADLEAAQRFNIDGQDMLLFMGSGTREKTRERALIFKLEDQTMTWQDLSALYKRLRKVAKLNDKEFINIEGIAANNANVFLLSRGSWGPNLIFTFKKSEFLAYILGYSEQINQITVQRVTLPDIDGAEATLSGGTWHQPTQQLIITASVEANGYGEVLGSFLSFAPHNALMTKQHLDLSQQALRVQYQDKPLISKIESVAITDYSNNVITGVLAADNDDGSSQFMTFSLTLHN